ncbi:MAG: hypothetical protein DRI61_12025, partial [Chloroflexi bacterium]
SYSDQSVASSEHIFEGSIDAGNYLDTQTFDYDYEVIEEGFDWQTLWDDDFETGFDGWDYGSYWISLQDGDAVPGGTSPTTEAIDNKCLYLYDASLASLSDSIKKGGEWDGSRYAKVSFRYDVCDLELGEYVQFEYSTSYGGTSGYNLLETFSGDNGKEALNLETGGYYEHIFTDLRYVSDLWFKFEGTNYWETPNEVDGFAFDDFKLEVFDSSTMGYIVEHEWNMERTPVNLADTPEITGQLTFRGYTNDEDFKIWICNSSMSNTATSEWIPDPEDWINILNITKTSPTTITSSPFKWNYSNIVIKVTDSDNSATDDIKGKLCIDNLTIDWNWDKYHDALDNVWTFDIVHDGYNHNLTIAGEMVSDFEDELVLDYSYDGTSEFFPLLTFADGEFDQLFELTEIPKGYVGIIELRIRDTNHTRRNESNIPAQISFDLIELSYKQDMSWLEYTWEITPDCGFINVIEINAWSEDDPEDSDDFLFEYSSDGTNYETIYTVQSTKNTTKQFYPKTAGDSLFIRVTDTDRIYRASASNTSIYVDLIQTNISNYYDFNIDIASDNTPWSRWNASGGSELVHSSPGYMNISSGSAASFELVPPDREDFAVSFEYFVHAGMVNPMSNFIVFSAFDSSDNLLLSINQTDDILYVNDVEFARLSLGYWHYFTVYFVRDGTYRLFLDERLVSNGSLLNSGRLNRVGPLGCAQIGDTGQGIWDNFKIFETESVQINVIDVSDNSVIESIIEPLDALFSWISTNKFNLTAGNYTIEVIGLSDGKIITDGWMFRQFEQLPEIIVGSQGVYVEQIRFTCTETNAVIDGKAGCGIVEFEAYQADSLFNILQIPGVSIDGHGQGPNKIDKIIDGVTTGYTETTGYGILIYDDNGGYYPITIELPYGMLIEHFNTIFWDLDSTFYYKYKIEIYDGSNWITVINKTDVACKGIQKDAIDNTFFEPELISLVNVAEDPYSISYLDIPIFDDQMTQYSELKLGITAESSIVNPSIYFNDPGTEARYVKISGMNNFDMEFRIIEAEIYTTDASLGNIALNCPVVSAGCIDGQYLTDGIIDSNYSYVPFTTQPVDMVIDLGQNYSLGSIDILFYNLDSR